MSGRTLTNQDVIEFLHEFGDPRLHRGEIVERLFLIGSYRPPRTAIIRPGFGLHTPSRRDGPSVMAARDTKAQKETLSHQC